MRQEDKPVARSTENERSEEPRGRPSKGELVFILPVAIFGLLALAFAKGLTLDPSKIPSALIGQPVPEFSLEPVLGRELGLSSGDLKGEVSMVNVFASWCVSCRYEHPVFMEIARAGVVPIHGLNYKDKPEDAAKWLDDLGDPYTRTGADLDGRVAIDWGVTGVPETFIIDTEGKIAFKQIGPVTREVWEQTMLPKIQELRLQSGPEVAHDD
jgi:cytochrome c biogenesis protein CcmG/thiol:disulfide interchange protein DsbE